MNPSQAGLYFGIPLRSRLMCFHAEPYPFIYLKNLNDLKDVVCPRVTARPKHTMYALVRFGCSEFTSNSHGATSLLSCFSQHTEE